MIDDQLPPAISDEAEYERVRAIADDLADQVGDDEDHALYSKFWAAMGLMEAWESEHVRIPVAKGRDVLKYLLEAHNLEFSDLPEIASREVVEAILENRQPIEMALAMTLGKRFQVEPSAFL